MNALVVVVAIEEWKAFDGDDLIVTGQSVRGSEGKGKEDKEAYVTDYTAIQFDRAATSELHVVVAIVVLQGRKRARNGHRHHITQRHDSYLDDVIMRYALQSLTSRG